MRQQIAVRNEEELKNALTLAQHTIYKKYLTELQHYPLVTPTPVFLDEEAQNCIRLLELKEFTCKKGEDTFQKLSTVYHASMSLGCHFIVMIDVAYIDAPAKIYIGVRNDGIDEQSRTKLSTSFRTLKNGMESNFPGTRFQDVPAQKELPHLLNDIFGEYTKHIAAVSCVAALRDKNKTEHKDFIQGLERLIDTMRGNTYTAILIAEPISTQEQVTIREGYENLYSILAPFQKSTWSYNENESNTVMENLSTGITKAVTNGVSDTQSHTKNFGVNLGMSVANDSTQSVTNSITHTDNFSKTNASAVTKVANTMQLIGSIATHINPSIGDAVCLLGNVTNILAGSQVEKGTSTSRTESIANAIGKTIGMFGGINAGLANTGAKTSTHEETETNSETKTTGSSQTRDTGKTLQIENINKPITEMLARIEEQLERVRESEDYGAYTCGAYFLSGKQESALLAANTYRSLMIGDGAAVENGAINIWNGEQEAEKVAAMKQYLSRFVHPVFGVFASQTEYEMGDFITYTPGTIVSGLELPLHLGLPTKSVYGLPVSEYAEFGRNVTQKYDWTENKKNITLGHIYHMGKEEQKSMVNLDVQELASHTFVTGSTGAGKSNTIYQLLNALQKQAIKFLIVEPAKGEYKTIFGKEHDVTVYGTNPKMKGITLLRINPFAFPKDIHILEHMDRLVEIFNVCWPMYAAMPAILKDAIERAYTSVGWNLVTSENMYDATLFPTFLDVLQQIKSILEESDYSADNKGDYTGALVTRIRSLTNGINGLIFCADAIPDADLFDKNAIVDLSRVGSTETKSLIMGLLVLKLQEYRMQHHQPNTPLQHITVLEEAHHLLKKTSYEQASESANLLGKSVEMLANSIAEMRTYGEGFVIADQSPGLLDLSVIRNTNTKIILRLPDFSDRELVGRAAGLNEDQIIELGRLERGVAAVVQSDWLEAVLCKVQKYEGVVTYHKIMSCGEMSYDKADTAQILLNYIQHEIHRKTDRIDIQTIKQDVIHSDLYASVKCDFIQYISANENEKERAFQKLIFDFFHAEHAIKEASYDIQGISQWANKMITTLNPVIASCDEREQHFILSKILLEQTERDKKYRDVFQAFTEYYRRNGGVF